MGMINLGSGLSALGASVADTAGHMAIEQQRSNMEEQKIRLADQLAGNRAWNAPGVAESVAAGKIGLQQKQNQLTAFNQLLSDEAPQAQPAATQAADTITPPATASNTGGAPTPPLPQGYNAIPPQIKAQMKVAFGLGGPEKGLEVYTKWAEEQNKIFDQRGGNRLVTGAGDTVGTTNPLSPPQPAAPLSPERLQQEKDLADHRAADRAPPANAWQVLNDKDGTPYRYNAAEAKATTLAGELYTPKGASKIGSGTARSAQAMAVQRFLQDNPGASADDIAHFSGLYQKTVNQLGGETKADVASLTQLTKLGGVASAQESAMTGAISQVTDLMNKGAGTSVGPVVNRWLQAGRKATGDKDVAAFNTAVETAANEYAKIITGSTAATDASRAEAASMMDKFQSPEALLAQIGVIQKDAHYKIQSYADHTDFIKQKLNDGGQGGASIPPPAKPSTGIETKFIEGQTYRDSKTGALATYRNGQFVEHP